MATSYPYITADFKARIEVGQYVFVRHAENEYAFGYIVGIFNHKVWVGFGAEADTGNLDEAYPFDPSDVYVAVEVELP